MRRVRPRLPSVERVQRRRKRAVVHVRSGICTQRYFRKFIEQNPGLFENRADNQKIRAGNFTRENVFDHVSVAPRVRR